MKKFFPIKSYKFLYDVLTVGLFVVASTPASAGLLDGLISSIDGVMAPLTKVAGQNRLKLLSEVSDRQLVDAFYTLSEDGSKQGLTPEFKGKFADLEFIKITHGSMTFAFKMFQVNNMGEASARLNGYSYTITDDLFGQKYLEVAKARGNTVKLYKPQLGKQLNSMFEMNFRFTSVGQFNNWIDRDNALIEYSPNGEIISFMTRAHQSSVNIGVTDTHYVNIFYGKSNAQFLENKVANNAFENNFLRVVTPAANNPVAVQPSLPETSPASVTQPQPNDTVQQASGTEIQMRPGNGDTARLGEKIVSINPTPQAPSPIKVNPEKRLQMLMQLGELKKSGVLTDQEFNAEKQRILTN